MKKVILYFKMLKFHRIINAFSIFRKEGLTGIKYHFYLVKSKEEGREKKYRKEYDISLILNSDTVDKKFSPLVFQKYKDPLVSIIIPVYNQFEYTYNCLKHIEKYTSGISYEIIIGDDCSSDMTIELDKIIQGIRVIHNQKNYQFLRNCNRISKEARGKYLVFLNNDTQVQSGWLDALVGLMEEDKMVGLAGSKLVYPNGLVQEAGGIVWRDATVLQFGNARQPGEGILNVKRETDYVSAASIIIRKELWDEMGGFDERFSPAYYEDVDLAFRVREKGYKVMYQSESEVIHFEGITERTSNREQKRKIENNRMLFISKWEDVLEKEHYEVKDYLRAMRDLAFKAETAQKK